jgi:hypothetical protein
MSLMDTDEVAYLSILHQSIALPTAGDSLRWTSLCLTEEWTEINIFKLKYFWVGR